MQRIFGTDTVVSPDLASQEGNSPDIMTQIQMKPATPLLRLRETSLEPEEEDPLGGSRESMLSVGPEARSTNEDFRQIVANQKYSARVKGKEEVEEEDSILEEDFLSSADEETPKEAPKKGHLGG